jgi:predicted nucleic acid-binding protein
MINVYTDTSVIGGCFDTAFKEHSLALFEEFKTGTIRLMYSDVVLNELQNSREEIKNKTKEIPSRFKTQLRSTIRSNQLAATYIAQGALHPKHTDDALHIAIATLNNADILASWNFKHIVNIDKIKLYNKINVQMGYRTIDIRTPAQILKPHYYEKRKTI